MTKAVQKQVICVFCGSSTGVQPAYRQAAEALGSLLGRQGRQLVYGGGNVGLMGALSQAAMISGARVTGIIPEKLHAMVPHGRITELERCPDMHSRKARMHHLAQGFIALPGGIGTLEELFETWTWQQLGYHQKPLGLLDVAGFWQGLMGFMDQVCHQGFMKPAHRDSIILDPDPERLLARMDGWKPASGGKLD